MDLQKLRKICRIQNNHATMSIAIHDTKKWPLKNGGVAEPYGISAVTVPHIEDFLGAAIDEDADLRLHFFTRESLIYDRINSGTASNDELYLRMSDINLLGDRLLPEVKSLLIQNGFHSAVADRVVNLVGLPADLRRAAARTNCGYKARSDYFFASIIHACYYNSETMRAAMKFQQMLNNTSAVKQ